MSKDRIAAAGTSGLQAAAVRSWPGPGVAADGDGWLPGFDPGPGPLAKLPALDFLHAGGLDAFQRGRGAPWPLRIAYETLIDVPAAARNGGIARLEYPLRGDGDATLQAMLCPAGRLNLSRDWPRFLAALEVVDRFSVPADGGMSAWLPIRVRSVPVRTGGVLRLDVSLPPGSDKGPRILRRVLRRLPRHHGAALLRSPLIRGLRVVAPGLKGGAGRGARGRASA